MMDQVADQLGIFGCKGGGDRNKNLWRRVPQLLRREVPHLGHRLAHGGVPSRRDGTDLGAQHFGHRWKWAVPELCRQWIYGEEKHVNRLFYLVENLGSVRYRTLGGKSRQ